MIDFELQEVPAENILMVKMKAAGAVADRISDVLNQNFTANHFVMGNKVRSAPR